MSADTVDTTEREHASFVDRMLEAARQAGRVSHEARVARTLAADAIEDGVRATERAVRRGIEKVEDVKDEGIHRVKRQPVKTLAIAAGVCLSLGLAAGWIVGRACSKRAGLGQR
jgi:ElaB/YqjD/DUF883 family membrane-anchored ribosome-binding protein